MKFSFGSHTCTCQHMNACTHTQTHALVTHAQTHTCKHTCPQRKNYLSSIYTSNLEGVNNYVLEGMSLETEAATGGHHCLTHQSRTPLIVLPINQAAQYKMEAVLHLFTSVALRTLCRSHRSVLMGKPAMLAVRVQKFL